MLFRATVSCRGTSVFIVMSVLEYVFFESELIYFMYDKLSVKWWLTKWYAWMKPEGC